MKQIDLDDGSHKIKSVDEVKDKDKQKNHAVGLVVTSSLMMRLIKREGSIEYLVRNAHSVPMRHRRCYLSMGSHQIWTPFQQHQKIYAEVLQL